MSDALERVMWFKTGFFRELHEVFFRLFSCRKIINKGVSALFCVANELGKACDTRDMIPTPGP